VPSDLYSYSFALNPDWTRAFPSQGEIWDYLRHCVDRFDVGRHLRFDEAVEEARWHDDARRWSVRTSNGHEYSAPALIWATGSLSEPTIPAFPGLDDFRGKVFHSARWEHGYDLKGKRVCVVGTGASAVQFVPQIAPVVEHLYLHQRTPPFIVPRHDRPASAVRRALFRRAPVLQRLSRLRIYLLFEALLSVFVGRAARPVAAVRKRALDHLHRQVPDPDLRETLTPHYEPGCKRLLLSDDFYPSLTRPNVEVVDAPVASFTAHEVVGQDGIARPVDVVIMGTGFEAAEPPYAQRIVGRDDIRLSERWKAEGTGAFVGSTVAGFPNLFFMIGPNSTLAHNSMIYMIESHINYVAGAVAFLSRPGVRSVEVRSGVQRRYNARLQSRLEHSVWVEGGCGSWYLDHRGRNTTLWPDHTWKFRRLTRHFHPGDYTVRA
jgi:cation diffusion facilitator CzcD-associated flavoprotein CzcO